MQLDSSNRTNDIALSPRDDFLYLTEAVGGPVPLNDVPGTQVINRYRVNGEMGEVSDKTVFYDFATNLPEPKATIDSDGMRTDTAGTLWVTRNGAGEVLVLTPEAALRDVVSLNQTANPTNLAFGGPKGTTLFVVGRCDGADFGTGSGCVEAVQTESVGREWALIHEGLKGFFGWLLCWWR